MIYQSVKTCLDYAAAVLLIIVLAPIMAVIALLIILESPGGAIFQQERVGKDGKPFTLYKFRSMYRGHDANDYWQVLDEYIKGNTTTMVDDKGTDLYAAANAGKVTRVGHFIRKTNIDELPQLVNIIKGDMSFVGPRPHPPFVTAQYTNGYWNRLSVKPGITGLVQVSDRRRVTFEQSLAMDIYYVNKQSLFTDTRIALRTVKTMLGGQGS